MALIVTTQAVADMAFAKSLVESASEALVAAHVLLDNGWDADAGEAFGTARARLDMARGYCELSHQHDLVAVIVDLDARIRAYSTRPR